MLVTHIASGNIVKAAQEQGIFVVLIDRKMHLMKNGYRALDVDTSEEKLKAKHVND